MKLAVKMKRHKCMQSGKHLANSSLCSANSWEQKLGVNVAWFQILAQPVVTDFNLGLLFPQNGSNDK